MTFQQQEPKELQVLAMAHELRRNNDVTLKLNQILGDAPPPGAYNPVEAFNKLSRTASLSFGISREAYKKVFIKHHPCPDLSLPGPGTYPVITFIGKEGRKSTIKGKIANCGFVNYRETSPGPCAYSLTTSINPTGHYIFSNYKNSMAARFNPVNSKRFQEEPKKVDKEKPGPGCYQVVNGISGKGVYYLSTIPSYHAANMARGGRVTAPGSRVRTATPGPGTYSTPSEFGYYSNARIDTLQKGDKRSLNTTQYVKRKSHEVGQYFKEKRLSTNKSVPSFNTLTNKL
jgi:hypothetical protein